MSAETYVTLILAEVLPLPAHVCSQPPARIKVTQISAHRHMTPRIGNSHGCATCVRAPQRRRRAATNVAVATACGPAATFDHASAIATAVATPRSQSSRSGSGRPGKSNGQKFDACRGEVTVTNRKESGKTPSRRKHTREITKAIFRNQGKRRGKYGQVMVKPCEDQNNKRIGRHGRVIRQIGRVF